MEATGFSLAGQGSLSQPVNTEIGGVQLISSPERLFEVLPFVVVFDMSAIGVLSVRALLNSHLSVAQAWASPCLCSLSFFS
jgi:hypothetical protein